MFSNSSSREPGRNPKVYMLVCLFLMAFAGLAVCMFLAITFGERAFVSFGMVGFFHYDPAITSQQIIHELRLPRVIGAAIVGAAFAVAGALMQGITRNPLADAGILGINGGSMLVVALCFAFFPHLPYSLLMLFSFLGAVLSTLFIALGSMSPGGLSPLRLTV
ncbi:iron chelate uptake ABC transporter family permease subunit [Fictibacillus enclensis]|uniref:iron chelate uptake ABC transporter family permease subunit n=1 Tax=Fictibacillus enclensis TaxID=1017270 RepID=UPI003CD0CE4B